MAYPEEDQAPGIARLYEQDPFDDIAWRYRFDEGELRFTWGARDAFGLDPVVPVETFSRQESFSAKVQAKGLPGISITVVGPDELERAAHTIAQSQDIDVPADFYSLAKPMQIDAVMSCLTTLHDEPDAQRAYLKRFYGDKWQEWSSHFDTPHGLPYLLAHIVPAIAKHAASTTLIEVIGPAALTLPSNKPEGRTLTEAYGFQVANAVHSVFCKEEHPD